MSKKKKVLFIISIGLNILLIAILTWGIIRMNFVKEQVLVTEVQTNLVELEGLIANQMEDIWSNPNLVTTKLGDTLNGIWLGMTTGKQLGTLSESDKKVLEHLYSKLKACPANELYTFVELTEEDKKNFKDLQATLRKAGLGLNMTISADMDTFMQQANELNEKIKSP